MADPRPARTRRRLLDAGHRLIAVNGVAALRIADVTQEAGVALGSFGNHFSSMDDLVSAVVREAIEALAAEIMANPAPGDGPAEVATAELRRFVRLADDDPAFCALLVNLARTDELFVEAIRPFAQVALRRAVKAGAFQIEDVDLAVTFIVAGALAVIRRRLDGLTEPDADSRLARLVLLGLGVGLAEAQRLSTLPLPTTRVSAEPQRIVT
jgi:AcrR family transcriptional regulator